MIERFIKNDLTLRRWRKFKSKRLAFYSLIIFLFSLFLTLFSPFLANSRPVFLTYQGKTYFPILKDYHPKEFGIIDSFDVDYRKLALSSENVLWPIIRWDPFESNEQVDNYPSPPSLVNLMGTDDRGRDVFVRLLYGLKYSISYAVSVWFFSFSLGILAGGIMGYFGGTVDFLGQRFVEVFSTIPAFFLLIILVNILTPGLFFLVTISSIFGWVSISYYVRGEFLKNRKRDFVEAAKSMGARPLAIIFKHILPNSLGPIVTYTPFVIAGNIMALTSLDYLGFGLEIPTPSWGELLAQAKLYYSVAWWLAVFPSLALFSTLTLLNLVGEGVREAMDPNAN